MRRVAYVLTPVDFGGAEKVAVTFLRHADRSRFDIRPVLLTRPWEGDNAFMRRISGEGYPLSVIPVALRPRGQGLDPFRVQRCMLRLYRLLSGQEFHLVHTHGYFADIIAAPVCGLLGIPHLATCHGYIQADRKLRVYNSLDKLALRFCDKVIAVSPELGRELAASGIHESRIVVIQNAVHPACRPEDLETLRHEKRKALSIGPDLFVIGYAGRLSPEKGVGTLLRAAESLKGQGRGFKVVLLGDGPERGELEEAARARGLGDDVLFLGFRDDAEGWLPALDLFVLPSLTEGTPMALLEAMSAGVPVVATAVGGVPKVLDDGINGFLVEPGDHREMADRIAACRGDRALRERVAAQGARTVRERFDVRTWCERIQGHYGELSERGER